MCLPYINAQLSTYKDLKQIANVRTTKKSLNLLKYL